MVRRPCHMAASVLVAVVFVAAVAAGDLRPRSVLLCALCEMCVHVCVCRGRSIPQMLKSN